MWYIIVGCIVYVVSMFAIILLEDKQFHQLDSEDWGALVGGPLILGFGWLPLICLAAVAGAGYGFVRGMFFLKSNVKIQIVREDKEEDGETV
jgi:hypothetical protein